MSPPRPARLEMEWPALPLAEWQETRDTLQRWAQIVGKTRLALAPMQNHWWQVVLHPTARGLTTTPMPVDGRAFEVEFDFLDHRLEVRTSGGAVRALDLAPMSVADFYTRYRALLRDLELPVRLWPRPVEMVDTIPFPEDREHAAYDGDAAQRCWRILLQSHRVLSTFRGRFLGKCSPVHFWWGGFDLACTRFSGRPAPPHPGGIPHLADWVTRESYSHECISVGWWPGGGGSPILEPAYYAYAYPEPAGCPDARVGPKPATYDLQMREWILPYDAVRTAPDPDAALLEFAQSTYDAAANLAGWDRVTLERGDAFTRAGS